MYSNSVYRKINDAKSEFMVEYESIFSHYPPDAEKFPEFREKWRELFRHYGISNEIITKNVSYAAMFVYSKIERELKAGTYDRVENNK